jgi:hypothetical protein
MNRNAVFSKTGKGLLEIKNKANRLSKDQYRVLNLVDGKANLVDLADRAKVSEIEVRKILTGLADGGYVKEFSNPAGDYAGSTVPPSTSYADDLDFTAILGPSQSAKPGFYQSAALEQRQREEAERKASEAAATRAREESERRAKEEADNRARAEAAARKVREDAERRAREEFERQERQVDDIRNKAENERKAREEAERRVREAKEAAVRKLEQDKLEAERRAKEEAERRVKIQAEARARVEADKRAREEAERKAREDEERRRLEEEQRKRREEEERKRREEEERKRRREEEERRKLDEEKRRREEEERKRREEEERKRREEEERKRREEEDRRRREEDEKRRREEEEERRRKEEAARRLQDEQERLKRDLGEKQRREQEELLRRMEEERHRLEDSDYRRQAEEQEREEEERVRADQRRQQEEQRRREEEELRRRREEDERRRAEDEKRRRKEEARKPKEEAFPSLDLTDVPIPVPTISGGFDTDLEALKRAEAEVEKEFKVKEDAIRQALEEQERRFRMEEEARAAMDRAEREARSRADREARELALAAEGARRDAEQKAREEAGRRAQEERERRAKDKEERQKQAEEDRKKREQQRREAEARAREEELARRRKDQQEQDRRKADLDRLQGHARRRAFGPGKMAAVGLLVLALLAVAVVEFAPMSAYAPNIEKAASEAVGEPVRVGGVRASLFPSFHVQLDNVTVGNAQDVRIGKVVAYMSFGSAFGEQKDIGKLVLEDVTAPQDALDRAPRWLSAEGKPAKISIERLLFKAARLELKGGTLPSFDADLLLAPDRSVRAATIETNDGRFTAELTPRESVVDVTARGRNFTPPLGPDFELTDFTAKGQIAGTRLRLTELEYSLYGGQGKGSASVSWGGVWTVEGDFSVQRVELEPAMKALRIDIVSDGTLEAKGRYVLQSAALERLLNGARVDAVFMVRKGNLSGLDLVRALQSPSRDGTAGGKTKFEELSGSLSASGGRYLYNGVRLIAGAMTATGQGEISPNQDVNGRTYVELRSSANVIRGNFRVQGSLKGMVLRP